MSALRLQPIMRWQGAADPLMSVCCKSLRVRALTADLGGVILKSRGWESLPSWQEIATQSRA
jgi:hypothetical protein